MQSLARIRRAHQKSRLGCFECKNRRTKCDEDQPTCSKCVRFGTRCIYPRTKPGDRRQSGQPPTVVEILPCRSLLPAPPVQSATEAQYLHHFLTIAYPSLPLGNDQVWKTEVPLLASLDAVVMSALLGVGATHLACMTSVNSHRTQALVLRGQALCGLRSALFKDTWTRSQVDSAIALVFLLAAQSQYMDDGLFDFMTMIRGSVVVSKFFMTRGHEMSFDLERTVDPPSVPEQIRSSLPALDMHCLEAGRVALDSFLPSLHTEEQLELFQSIRAVFQASKISTQQGFEKFWLALDHGFPSAFVNPDATVRVLQAFLVALRLLLEPVTRYVFTSPNRLYDTREEILAVTMKWALGLVESIAPSMRKYVGWPEAIVASRELR